MWHSCFLTDSSLSGSQETSFSLCWRKWIPLTGRPRWWAHEDWSYGEYIRREREREREREKYDVRSCCLAVFYGVTQTEHWFTQQVPEYLARVEAHHADKRSLKILYSSVQKIDGITRIWLLFFPVRNPEKSRALIGCCTSALQFSVLLLPN